MMRGMPYWEGREKDGIFKEREEEEEDRALESF